MGLSSVGKLNTTVQFSKTNTNSKSQKKTGVAQRKAADALSKSVEKEMPVVPGFGVFNN